jgi:aryl-alcohol dehydrogenase-like predicted oxidoreductase
MNYVNLGNTGLKVSRICLGTMTYGSKSWRQWVLEEEESLPFIRRALELGINFFDTADIYSLGRSEEILGKALKEFAPERERIVVATKLFQAMGDDPNERGLSRKHIRHAIDNSLRRLQLDYIDLYQIHRFDPHTPIEETVEALGELVDEGKVLYLGASSMWAWQFATMLHTADQLGTHRFATMQNHYNLLYREEEADERVVDDLVAVAKNRGVPPAQIALAWLLHQPAIVAPIVGASKMPHLEDAIAAEKLTLSDDEIATLEKSYVPHAIAGHE